MELDYAYEVFRDINKQISKLKEDGYVVDYLKHDSTNPEEVYRNDLAETLLWELADLQYLLKWMQAPVTADGRLWKNDLDRYEIGKTGIELTSGRTLDVYDEERERWRHSAIEHNTKDYYIKALGQDTNLEGAHVRIRG